MFFSEADIDECTEGITECHNHSRCVNLPTVSAEAVSMTMGPIHCPGSPVLVSSF